MKKVSFIVFLLLTTLFSLAQKNSGPDVNLNLPKTSGAFVGSTLFWIIIIIVIIVLLSSVGGYRSYRSRRYGRGRRVVRKTIIEDDDVDPDLI